MQTISIATYTTHDVELERIKLIDLICIDDSGKDHFLIEGYVNDKTMIVRKTEEVPWGVTPNERMPVPLFQDHLAKATFLGDTFEEVINTLKTAEAKFLIDQ